MERERDKKRYIILNSLVFLDILVVVYLVLIKTSSINFSNLLSPVYIALGVGALALFLEYKKGFYTHKLKEPKKLSLLIGIVNSLLILLTAFNFSSAYLTIPFVLISLLAYLIVKYNINFSEKSQ